MGAWVFGVGVETLRRWMTRSAPERSVVEGVVELFATGLRGRPVRVDMVLIAQKLVLGVVKG